MPGRKLPPGWANIFNLVVVPITVGAFYLLVGVYKTYETMATKPYVDDRFTSAIKYTDQKTTEAVKDAFEHSDANRQAMMMEMTKIHADNREAMARVNTTLEILLKTVDKIREDHWSESRKKQDRR